MTRKLITIAEFCAEYRVSRSTFYRIRDSGQINPIKIGRATRVAVADADNWLATLSTIGEAIAEHTI